jgi:hypothetical protein
VRKPTPFDPSEGFPSDKLPEMVRTLKEQLEKAQMDRNQIQVDRVSQLAIVPTSAREMLTGGRRTLCKASTTLRGRNCATTSCRSWQRSGRWS